MTLSFRHALLAASVMAGLGGGVAVAQTAPASTQAQPPAAAQSVPAIKGTVAQYTLTPRGDVDGFILQDGTEVHLPPHLSTLLVYTVKPGDTVTIHGLKAAAVPMVQAMSVTNDATGKTVTDNGPAGRGSGMRGPREMGQAMQVQGKVKEQLHGPRGDLNGVLLEDGTMVRLPPPEAQRLATELAPGQTIYASGNGVSNALGKVVAAQSIGPSEAQASVIAAPPPGHGPGHHHGRPGGPPPGGPGAPPPPNAG